MGDMGLVWVTWDYCWRHGTSVGDMGLVWVTWDYCWRHGTSVRDIELNKFARYLSGLLFPGFSPFRYLVIYNFYSIYL